MSRFFSAIMVKGKLLYDLDIDSHGEIIEKFKGEYDLSYHRMVDPHFVRLELLPVDRDVFNHDLTNWKIHVDQEKLPRWFDKDEAESLLKNAVKEVFAERFIINQPGTVERKDQRVWVKNTSIILHNFSKAIVETWGSSNASVITRDSSDASVIAYDSSKASVEMWGFSKAIVETWGSSNASVITWFESKATTTRRDNSTITKRGGAITENGTPEE